MQYFMQQSLLDDFKQQIKDIQEYIEHINLTNNIPKKNRNIKSEHLQEFTTHLKKFRMPKKEFEYKAIIISLYGVLENTISKWIQEHIQNISTIVNDYRNLEDKFKKDHFTLSIQLISMINDDRYSKFDKFDKESILKKLNQTISTPNDFELNSEAYIPTSGNLKHSKIVEAFKPLNIDLNAWEKKLHREISMIDDLVVRRNDIAHGVNIDDILNSTVLQEYINCLQRYITNIFDVLIQKEIEYFFCHRNDELFYIDNTKEVFADGKVCIVNIKDNEIKVGDTLLIKRGDIFSKATLLSIQEKNQPLILANNGEFGLQLDCRIKENSKIWKLRP